MDRRKFLNSVGGLVGIGTLSGCVKNDTIGSVMSEDRSGTIEAMYVYGRQFPSEELFEEDVSRVDAEITELVAITTEGINIQTDLIPQDTSPEDFEIDGAIERAIRDKYGLEEYLIEISEKNTFSDPSLVTLFTTREMISYLQPGDEISYSDKATIDEITSLNRPNKDQVTDLPIHNHVNIKSQNMEQKEYDFTDLAQVSVEISGVSRSTLVNNIGIVCRFDDSNGESLEERGLVIRSLRPFETFDTTFHYTAGNENGYTTQKQVDEVESFQISIVDGDDISLFS